MLLLCSASPRRAELLSTWGIPLIISPADVLEEFQSSQSLTENLLRITIDKLNAGCTRYEALCKDKPGTKEPAPAKLAALAADTIVHVDEMILGKPAGEEAALDYLQRLSGNTHQVTTAFAVRLTGGTLQPNVSELDDGDGELITGTETSLVHFNELTEEQCLDYIRRFEPFDKAGSYGIQDDFPLVKSYEGSFSNIVGLPMNRLLPLLWGGKFLRT